MSSTNFPVFHGISLAANSWIENATFEVLTTDPVPVGPGRIWFNATEKTFKYSGLNATGAVVVRSFKSAEEAAAEIAALQLALANEEAAREADDVATLSSAQTYADSKKAEAIAAAEAYTDSVKAEIMGGIPPATLDTLTELAAALRDNPDIVTVLETKIGTDIAAAKEELKGTVSAAMDTLGEIEAAITQEIADRQAADTAEATARAAAITALITSLNSERFTYESDTAGTTHVVAHNFNSQLVDVGVWVLRDGKWRNDMAGVVIDDNNTVKVYLSSAAKVLVTVQCVAQITTGPLV